MSWEVGGGGRVEVNLLMCDRGDAELFHITKATIPSLNGKDKINETYSNFLLLLYGTH